MAKEINPTVKDINQAIIEHEKGRNKGVYVSDEQGGVHMATHAYSEGDTVCSVTLWGNCKVVSAKVYE